jgi:calcium-dependent protein kinase
LTRKKNLSEQLAAKIIMQVMKALAYCHSRGVLHRNLRMESLILQSAPSDDNVHVILTGFGSTALLSLKEILSTKIGSALFIAPETLRYEPSDKADVWSCGVILHMLLCGNPPFNGPTTDSIIEQIAEEPVTFPQGLWDGVSSEAINLLRGMLKKDPAARLSLRECLGHPWICTNTVCGNHDSKPIFQALRNLKAFEAKKKVKQTILSFMAAHFDTQEETKALRDAFMSVDTNGDGRLSLEELISAYCQIMTREEAVFVAEKVIKCVDLDHNGHIDYSEFMLATKNHKMLMTSRNLRSIFTQFDRDSSGKISFSEFREALGGQKLQTDDEMWAELLAEVDSDGDGELNFQEFTKLMLAAVDMNPGKLRK